MQCYFFPSLQRIIDDLFQYVERLQERKADRENVATEMDVKADKHALDGKVNRSTFEETFQMFDRGTCAFGMKKRMGRCSSSWLAAGRAELQRTQLWRSSCRRHIEGVAGCRLTTQCYGAQLRWKGWPSIYLDPQPTLSTFQVGGNRSTRRKPTTFGRTNSSHMSVASPNRDLNPRSQRWKALALTIAPPKPLIVNFPLYGEDWRREGR